MWLTLFPISRQADELATQIPEAPVDPTQVDVSLPDVPTHEPVPANTTTVAKTEEQEGRTLVAA
jgi:hypothetical protein